MTADEFENPDSSPVPPHDRTWRHPAELADAQRSAHLTAPPLGRRLTAITVVVSALSSFVVLSIAVPRGIQEYSESSPDTTTTTVVAPVRGTAAGSLGILDGRLGATSALSLGNGRWLVATETLGGPGTDKRYTVLREDRVTGLSVIRVAGGGSAPAVDLAHMHRALTSEQLSGFTIVDAFGRHEVAPEPSLTSQSKAGVHPVNMSSSIRGIALALDRKSRVVGVLVRHDHAQWSLTRETVQSLATP